MEAPSPQAAARPRSIDAWLATALFLAYGVFFYRDILFTDSVYVFRDLYTLFYAIEHVARRLASDGWPPLWNPFAMLGKPFAADPSSGVYYPPNFLLRLLPLATGYNISLVLHHALAAVGAYLVGRRAGFSFFPALLGGLVYAFAGPLVSCDNLYFALLAATWAPWAILALLHWIDRPSARGLALLALALSLSLLAAMPEFTLFTNLLLAAVALAKRNEVVLPKALLAIGAANLAAAGLCAVLLLPSAELIGQSSRAGGLNVANALQHSLPYSGLLSFVLSPHIGTAPEGAAPWMITLYFGPILALAAVAAVASPRRRGWWIALAAVFLCLAFGANLPGYAWLIEHVAPLRVVRYPEKFLFVVHAVLALGIGAGLELLLQRWSLRRVIPAGFAAALIVLLVAVDLYNTNAGLLPSAPWSEVASQPTSASVMQASADPLRIYANAINLPPLPPYPDGFLLEKDLMLMTAANLYDIADINAPMTINLRDHEQLEELIETLPRERVAAFIGSLNTAYVTSVRALDRPGFELVRSPSTPLEAYVYRIAPLAPRATVPAHAVAAGDPGDALDSLRGIDVPAETVVLESDTPLPAAPEAMQGEVALVRHRPAQVELRASLATPAWIVLSDTFAPGWIATIDDRPVPIVRANRFARAVFAEAGDHRVVFDYRPASHVVGVAISLVFALGIAVALAIGPKHRRLRRAPGS